ncbi:MAG: hypothetical protein MZV70_46090 [Desulfobacterales bacterium]|nr:hypothetical protein [Desulfobacterales bacterium]
MMGGRIGAEQPAGAGQRLRLHSASSAVPPEPPAGAAVGARRRCTAGPVLVVDDNADRPPHRRRASWSGTGWTSARPPAPRRRGSAIRTGPPPTAVLVDSDMPGDRRVRPMPRGCGPGGRLQRAGDPDADLRPPQAQIGVRGARRECDPAQAVRVSRAHAGARQGQAAGGLP